jgi:hypothetical protein
MIKVANGNILHDRKGNKNILFFLMCENLRAQYHQDIRGL